MDVTVMFLIDNTLETDGKQIPKNDSKKKME